jgi:uncharacterized protein (TIGR02246 family)
MAARANAADSGAQIVDAAWISAIKANDIDAVMKCYAPDAIMWLPDAPTARGAKAIRAAYEGLLSANTVKDATLSEVTYRTVGKASLAWGNFSLTLVPKAGGDQVVMKGRFTEVAERRGGKWVYIVDHASAEPAP